MKFLSSSISLTVKSSIGNSFSEIVIFHINALSFENMKQNTTKSRTIIIEMKTPNNI